MRSTKLSPLLLALSCMPSAWHRQELHSHERLVLGCYELRIGPWPDSVQRIERIRVLADSLAGPSFDPPIQRRLIVHGPLRAPAYWSAPSPDSLELRMGLGREAQALVLILATRGDSLSGRALQVSWPHGRIEAPAEGQRSSCDGLRVS